MKLWEFLWVLTLVTAFFVKNLAQASDLPKWATEHHRTQGGGWIWFPGAATANTIQKADMMAKGAAINSLELECTGAHKSAKFHERFVEQKGERFTVHVRISIKNKACRSMQFASKQLRSKLINQKLDQLARQYRAFEHEDKISNIICNGSIKQCFLMASEEFEVGNILMAGSYALSPCKQGHALSCNIVGIVKWELGFHNQAFSIFNRECARGDSTACELKEKIKQVLTYHN